MQTPRVPMPTISEASSRLSAPESTPRRCLEIDTSYDEEPAQDIAKECELAIDASTIAPSEASSRFSSPVHSPRPCLTIDTSDVVAEADFSKKFASKAPRRCLEIDTSLDEETAQDIAKECELAITSDVVAEADFSKKFASKAPRRCLEIDTSLDDEETSQDIAKQCYEMNNVYEDPPSVPWYLRPPKGEMCFPRHERNHFW